MKFFGSLQILPLDYNSILLRLFLRISIQFHFQVNRRFFIGQIHQVVFKKYFNLVSARVLWNPFFLICGSNIADRRFVMDYNKLFFNACPTEVCNWGERFPSCDKVRTSTEFEAISHNFLHPILCFSRLYI